MSRIIRSNGAEENICTNGKLPLDIMQKAVGGYIEILHLGDNFLVCNEEGKLLGLPLNVKATMMVREYGYADCIAGDVIICSDKEID